MSKLLNTPTKVKTLLTVNVSPDIALCCEYSVVESRTIYPDPYFSMEAESIATEQVCEHLGLGPDILNLLSETDRKQLHDLIAEAA